MPEQLARKPLIKRIVRELSKCRERGIDDLDLDAHNKPPMPLPELERLARAYCDATGATVDGRVAAIRTLLQGGLVAYAERGNEANSQFISSLFFDTSGAIPKRGPKALMAEVRQPLGMGDRIDDARFGEHRRAKFAGFAAFLLAFVAETVRAAAAARSAPTETPIAPPASMILWRFPIRLPGIVVTGLVVLSGLVMTLLYAGTLTPSQGKVTHAQRGVISSTKPYDPGTTYHEVTGEFGAPTFTDPHSPAVTGLRIAPYTAVRVVCKVYAPTIPSASPDGYWYRIASAPWDGRYFAVANTFLNGDKVGAPAMHNTDFAVPDCPSQDTYKRPRSTAN